MNERGTYSCITCGAPLFRIGGHVHFLILSRKLNYIAEKTYYTTWCVNPNCNTDNADTKFFKEIYSSLNQIRHEKL